ncbi:MAG: DUF1573 domain-containing protein [Bacteroidales bacterium]|nr:DUF1573 domain-containing protein [Bacteroidales bacterium]
MNIHRRNRFCGRLSSFLLSSVLALTMLSGCRTGEHDASLIKNPYSASGYDSTLKMPRIVFDCNQYDFGRLTSDEKVSYSFHFRNTGGADLIITGCDASCGCTVADYPRQKIAPGDDGYVTITFSSAGKSGQQVKEVTVNSNAQPAMTRLRILAQVF